MTDFLAGMSQADKVLHLYVEVRAVGDDKGKELLGGDNGSNLRMLQCPDVLPHSHRGFVHSSPSRSPDLSPVTPHRSRALSQSLPPSRCSSRQTVHFQLPNHDDARCPTPASHRDMLYGSLGQLLDVHAPGMPRSGSHGPYAHYSNRGSYHEWMLEPPSSAVGRLSVPSTPASYRRFYEGHGADGDHGKTSVVRFGYVEKASVNAGSQRSSLCHYDTDNPFHEIKDHVHLRKRNSDPGWHLGPEVPDDSFFTQYRPVYKSQMAPTHFRRSTLEAVAKDATHRALKEFGSPELKRRYESYSQENSGPNLPQHHQPQRSWSPSPSPIRHNKSPTLPSRSSHSEVTRAQRLPGVTAPHTSKQFSSPAASPSLSSRRFSQNHHQQWEKNEHIKSYNNTRTHLPAGRPTDIQHSISTSNFSKNNYSRTAFQMSGNISHSDISWNAKANDRNLPNNTHQAHSTLNARTTISPENDLSCFSSSCNVEMASKSAVDGARFSKSDRVRLSPVPSHMDSPVMGSPNTRRTFYCENQPNASTHWQNSPQPLQPDYQTHKMDRRTPQTMAGYGSPLLSPKCLSSSKSLSLPTSLNHTDLLHCPEMQSDKCVGSNNVPFMQCPCEQPANIDNHQYPSAQRRERHHVFDRSFRTSPEVTRRGTTGPPDTSANRTSRCEASRGERSDENDQNCANGVYAERKEEQPVKSTPQKLCPKSEPSKVSHMDTSSPLVREPTHSRARTQTDHVLRVPASRSDKIAKAKWEFLFGAPSEECRCTEGSPSVAPSRASVGPCVRGPRDSAGQKLLHHKVQQIEVELFSPDPHGSSSGIIRRTLKYSETDLDAVPLRCYRETDLDQVMQAEAEVFEENEAEVDSAFGSDRSILGASSFSPEDGERKERVLQEEELRVRPTREKQDLKISREMVRPLEPVPDSHCALKSPVSLTSPRCSSDTNLDSFSRHFESIMESHRAKGTSYSSLDSVDVLTSGSTSVFTFDLPTLTPEIQSQISETARQLMDLSFAPLSHPHLPGSSETSSSEVIHSASNRTSQDCSTVRVQSMTEKGSARKDGFKKVSSAPSLHSSLREHVKRPPELLYPQADVAQRLARADSIDALNGIKADLQAAKRLAKRLYSLDGFKKCDVARHLNKNNEFSQTVAEEYLSLFDFSGLTIDQALRLFLRRFALVGETQERERVLTHFSHRYRQCNPHGLNTEDSVHTLTCAVMLLNSDLHGNNVGKRMSCSQFISNLEGLNNGKDFPKELLKTLYTSIRSEKLQWTIDEEEVQKPGTTVAPDARKDSASHTLKRLGPSGNPLLSMAQQGNEQLYKSGLLVRKIHADQDGKRTPRGKRGWKSFYGTLKGLVLYLQKEEYRSGQEMTQEDLKNAVSIHHSLAMRAADYSKRANVFYLRTADWRVFLFQAPSAEQMQSWITRINVVSAMFSAPPFPPAIGSQKRFSRPLLPGSNTKLSQEEQLKSHETRFRAVSTELAELITDSKVKGRDVEEQRLRQEYLEFEKTRYGTYAMLMRAKLQSGTEDLSAFESRLLSEGGLHRAHSSPALPQYSSVKDKDRNNRSRSLKVTSTQTKEESHNGTQPDNKPESKDDVP